MADCTSSGDFPATQPASSGKESTAKEESEPVRDDVPELDKEVEIGFFEPSPVVEIFEEIAMVYFGDRLEVVGDVNSTFQGEITRRPLREVLDRLCAEAGCTWRVEGDPPILILQPEGDDR